MSDKGKGLISYCAVHDTYPAPFEPCWQCANPFIQKAYQDGLRDSKDVAMTQEEWVGAQLTSLYSQGMITKEEYEEEVKKLDKEVK